MYFVYLLKSLKDKKYYLGYTNNVQKRFSEHNNGKVISTKNRRPFILLGYETYEKRNEASWAEYNYKHHSDKKKKFIVRILEKATGPEGLWPGGR